MSVNFKFVVILLLDVIVARSDRKLVVSIGSANGYYNVVFLGSVS